MKRKILILMLAASMALTGVACGNTSAPTELTELDSAIKDGLKVSSVRNDTTGNWKYCMIVDSDLQPQDYALEYYQKYFESDSEVHAVINASLKTTNKITVIGDKLDLTVFEYVDGEEHDASSLFGGQLYHEYHIDKTTGDVEQIQ